ncbi:hypothetical protein [Hyalangium sp.]|uniref:hypothetical protein n=1 Tax=Hyalangium sp. TaxID=2028555 RepID=UPI002D7271A8|nr:hypothetical protein [Hyalangium sp.]HYI00733.1 hypothetical protein [Hyalangium sp.]
MVPSDLSQDGGGGGFWAERDDFQLLQQSAGLEEDSWHEAGEELETEDAQALWEALARTGTTLQSFGPGRSLAFVLRQVRTQDEDVPYAELLQRLRPFRFLVVMRPDGYLVSALTGRPLQRMWKGRVELRGGRLMVGTFEVGAFYRDKGGVFYTVDDSLSQPGAMVGELGLERDWFNAALDGGGDALGEMAQALAHFVNDPIRSLEGLEQLPSAVAALIASSPDYFARYSALPVQEQIREAARLATHLMMLYGSAAGTATRIGTAGTKLPVLSLSAEGALAIEQVAVPVGATAAAVGTGAGAVYVLMESTKDPGEGGGAQASGTAKGAGGGFKPFVEGNFRENLARLTGRMPEDAHAHHVFPRALEKNFKEAGINIHDPRFGTWWERSSHLKKAHDYTQRWREFLFRRPPPSFEQILQFGRELAREYGFQVNY